jgi:hypothetical protein
VFTLPHRAPLGPVLAQLGRVFSANSASLTPRGVPPGPPPHDPEFLPDFATLTPDQAQEVRYGVGRGARGRGR